MLSHHIWSRSRISRIIIYAIVATTIILISAAGSNVAVLSFSDQGSRTATTPVCTPPPSGMLGWWPGDGNAFDIKGGNNGTPQNGVTFSAGRVGQAMSFNGVNQYVSLSNVDFRSNAAGSMGFWIQTTDAGAPITYGNLKGAFFGRGNSVDQHLHLGIASGKLTIEWYLSGHHSIQGTSNIADGNWHYVVFVSDGAGTVSLYVDGVLENLGSFFHTSGSTSTRFGSEYEGLVSYSYFYNGLIDEVEYFSRAISLSEVQAIYNAGSAGTCRSCTPPPSGMVGWWTGDGNAGDVLGSNNGTWVGTPSYVNGMVSQALSFNGSNYVEIPDAPSLRPNLFTVDAWVYPTNISGNHNVVFKGNHEYLLQLRNGNVLFGSINAAGAYQEFQGSLNVPVNTWSHVAITHDGATKRIYVNGVLDPVTQNQTGHYTTNTGTLKIGTHNTIVEFFSGSIDEVEIFDRDLSLSEIRSINNAGSAGKCRSCKPPPSGMLGWWPGDGDANDIQGPTFENGTLVNGTTYAPGMVGQAFSFDGADDRVDVGGTPIELGTAPFTADFWMKTADASHVTHAYLVGKSHPDGGAGWDIRLGSNAITVVGVNGWAGNITSDASITNNVWHHVAITSNGTTVELYIDGLLKGTCPRSAISSTSNPTRFGFTTDFGGLPFNGLLDEIEIFGRGLSQAEVQAIYNAGSAGMCRSCAPVPVGLVSLWTGNDNGLDVRGPNNGTLQNGATFATGHTDKAFSFNGANQHVEVPDSPSLRPTNGLTLEGWFEFNSSSPNAALISKPFSTGSNNAYVIWVQSNSLNAGIGIGILGVPFTPVPGRWYHIGYSYDQATHQHRLLLDGEVVAGAVSNTPLTYDAESLLIGVDKDGGTPTLALDGMADDVGIYDRALTVQEVRSIWSAGCNGKCSPTAVTPPSGLVGWWGGDGFETDVSGNNNHGTLINGADYAVGKVGQAFNFDGVNDYVEVAGSVFDPGSAEFSVEFWMNSRNSGANSYLLGKSLADGGQGWDIRLNANMIRLVGVNGWGFNLDSDVSVTPNTWHHITVSSTVTTVSLYVDGVLKGTCPRSAIGTTANPLRFGYTTNYGGPAFNGLMDEITFYNRAITQTEIQSIVNAGLAGKLKQTPTAAPAPTVKGRKMRTANDVGIYAFDGDATILFPAVTASGMTHEIPLDPVVLPPLPLRTVGLTYDIATSARYTGTLTVCFNLPSFTTTEFATLHILHLENGGWVDVTYASSAYPSLCALNLTSLSPFAIVTTAPTAAELSIAGRVLTAEGRGIRGAFVTVTGTGGDVRNVPTGNLGRYIAGGLTAGETYIVTVRSRRFTFAQPTRVITLNDNVTDADFIGSSGTSREQ